MYTAYPINVYNAILIYHFKIALLDLWRQQCRRCCLIFHGKEKNIVHHRYSRKNTEQNRKIKENSLEDLTTINY